ncbi:MAG TPA: ABC transporter ATP-binding protein [Bacteroidia bacterium]|nr:ABC transporter ATP-binding protein [Bacteroidia bacterium]
MVEIKTIYKKFGKLEVLKGLDLSINKGGIFVILGPNGSGKTTLIKCILGMVLPDKGDILINNKSILKEWHYRSKLNYMPQIANFPKNITVNELINMIKDIRSQPSCEANLIKLFELTPYLNKKLGTLSGGTKQKVNIVLSFMFNSDLIILDEPTTGLDPISLLSFKKLLFSEKENGKTILLTTHIMSLVEEIADEIVFLLDGKIYFKGTVTQLKEITFQDNLEQAIASILRKENINN